LQTESSTELSPQVARARLPELQAQLAVRQSTTHFARSGVSLVGCAIFTAAAAKLFWDSIRFPVLGAVATALAIALVVYAWVQYRRGMMQYRREMELFASLQAVHRALHLDDPAALLPR
jgi:O-antigen/teichoic acid export membrane protein